MIEPELTDRLYHCEVIDTYGETVGPVAQLWLADGSGLPLWASVHTGMFGRTESILPLQSAELHDEQVHVPFSKDQISQAPQIDTASPAMTEGEQTALSQHYGLQPDSSWTAGAAEIIDPDLVGTPGSDDRMLTRSEERATVGTERVAAGRVRLVKYVVTELQQVTIPVSHEEVRLEREPITDPHTVPSAHDLHDTGTGSEPEITLYAERPVVHTEIVPVERVRQAKNTVVDEQTATAPIQKERIGLHHPSDERPGV